MTAGWGYGTGRWDDGGAFIRLTIEEAVYLWRRQARASRLEPARQWFDSLTAPHKEWITFGRSGHIPQFEESCRLPTIPCVTWTVFLRTKGSICRSRCGAKFLV